MLLISEYKLDNSTIANYKAKGYRVAYGYEQPVIHKGEAVGFLLDTMYKSTIDLIEYLLFTRHKLILKYQDKNYRLETLDEWHRTYTENKRVMHFKHPLYIEYESKRQDYLDRLTKLKNKKRQEDLLNQYDFTDIPKDLDMFVSTFSRLYNLMVDMNSETDKIICYNQIKTYMDLGLPYMSDDVKDAHSLEGQAFMYSNCINADESPFSLDMFQDVDYQDNISVESYGDETYLEDTIYKGE